MRLRARAGERAGRRVLLIGALFPAYVLLALGSRELGGFDALTVWYTPAGLALGAFIILGRGAFPALALGELVGGIVVFHVDSAFTPAQMIINACGYAATYGVVGMVLRRHGLLAKVDSVQEAGPLIASGLVIAPALAALFGVTMQAWAGLATEHAFWESVYVWWVGDAIGIATVTPPLFVLALIFGIGGRRLVPAAFRRTTPVPLVAELVAPSVVAVLVFAVSDGKPGLVGLIFAPVALVALRYGVAGIAVSLAMLSPLVTVMADERVGGLLVARTEVQTLLLALMTVGYVLGLVVDERSRITQYHRELGEIIEATTDFVAVVRRDGTVRYLNPAGRRSLGFPATGGLHDVREEHLYPEGTSTELATEVRRTAEQSGTWRGDVVLRGGDGNDIVASKVVIAHYDSSQGRPLRTTSILRDVSDERRLEAQLARKALFDDLTLLPNRAWFFAQLELLVEPLHEGLTSVLVVRLDGYDALHDGFGMEVCDEVLREVGQRLALASGTGATVARLEGHSFGVLPESGTLEADAIGLGERLTGVVAGPFRTGDRLVALTASVGVAELHPDVAPSEVVRAADVAAHRAQVAGGDRVVCHMESMTVEAHAALVDDAFLRNVVKTKEFSLVYQTVFDAGSRQPVAIEALVRLAPDQSPYSFILLAERNGLIVPLGREILRRACGEFAAGVPRATPIALHVNVSVCQLAEDSFVREVGSLLEATGIDPEQLTIEVTETVAADPVRAVQVLGELRVMGAKIALDDFGAGYSSLATLDRLPIDEVKLDRSFTSSLAVSARTEALVGATIDLAHGLGLVVVAEGVEDEDQMGLLVNLDCDRIQGFLLGRPAPLDTLLL